MDTYSFDNSTWKKNVEGPNFFLLHVRKWQKSFQKIFTNRCTHGHVKRRFENPVGKKSTSDQHIFTLFPKKLKILNVSKPSFSPKKFQWTRRMQFHQIRSKNSTEKSEVFAHCPKVMEKPNLPKKCFPQIFLLTRSMEFWRTCRKPCRRNQQKPIKFHSISENYRKIYVLRKKISSDFSYGQPV